MDFRSPKLNDPRGFAEAFLSQYVSGSFGSLSKRDVDILVFHLLVTDGQYDMPKDLYKVCRELGLTETKVRNLYQAVQLKYQQYGEEEAKRRLSMVVQEGSIEAKGDKLTFVIRDPLLRQYFEEWVADQNGFTDSSFNKNLVTIRQQTFINVLERISVADVESIMGTFEDELKPFNDSVTVRELLKQFVDEFAKSAGKEAGAMSFKAMGIGLRTILIGM